MVDENVAFGALAVVTHLFDRLEYEARLGVYLTICKLGRDIFQSSQAQNALYQQAGRQTGDQGSL